MPTFALLLLGITLSGDALEGPLREPDYRAEIFEYAIAPCYLDVVRAQGGLFPPTAEVAAMILRHERREDVEDWVETLTIAVEGEQDPDERFLQYFIAHDLCVMEEMARR